MRVHERTALVSLLAGLVLFAAGPPATYAAPQSGGTSTTAAKKPAPQTRSSLARSRAAAAARARQAALARQREAETPQFKRDLLGNLVPHVRAAAAIIYDPQTGAVLWGENPHEQRSIASLTKLMTAVTFIADEPNLDAKVKVVRQDTLRASTTYLRTNDVLSYRDLLHLTLIASDNAAARVLARTSEGGTAAFVARMNEMATHLGLTNTQYTEPSGLDARNVSSAYDISHLIAYASADPQLGSVMRLAEYTARTQSRTIEIRSTNKLLGLDGVHVLGGKTGFIRAAGYCLATLFRIPQGPQVAVVVLGATNSTTRFWDARHLFNWVVGRTQGIVGGDQEQQ